MADRNTIHRLIDEAIRTEKSVYIRYRDYHGNESKREITPLEWVEPEKILAFCHLRNEQRNFRTSNITEISREAFAPVEQTAQLPAAQSPIQAAVLRPTPRRTPTQNPPVDRPRFTRVTTANQWASLMGYYRECLNHEYQQQFSLKKDDLFYLDLDEKIVHAFLSGNQNLELRPAFRQDRLKSFLNDSRRRNQQLCLGKSFVCLNSEKISPLLFTPITVEKGLQDVFVLKPEECNLSYAALMNLGFQADEITSFVEEYQTFISNQPTLQDTEKFLQQALSGRLIRPLSLFSHEDYSIFTVGDYAIFDGAGLFWVNNEFTGSLISELKELADAGRWRDTPEIIHHLFDNLPEHEHPPAPDFVEDQRFYVTNINAQQRKAARAVAEHPVTIVTGPPGTGKSQLVLNLIAQAYLDGKTVLFASHNNKAVDVVMDRLQGEIRFQGAIRTGSRPNRKKAAEQMESAIAQVHQPAIQDFETRYQNGKRKLKEANDKLDLIRDLKGKIQSYQVEKTDVQAELSQAQREQHGTIDLPFIEADKIRLKEILSLKVDQFRSLIDQRDQLVALVRDMLLDRGKKEPVVQMIREYEMQWGRFAGGLIHSEDLQSLTSLVEYCENWEKILACLSAKKNNNLAQRLLLETKKRIDRKTAEMAEEQNLTALSLAEERTEADLEHDRQVLNKLQDDIERLRAKRYSFFKRIGVLLMFIHPEQRIAKELNAQAAALGVDCIRLENKKVTVEEIHNAAFILENVIEMGSLLKQMQRMQQTALIHAESYDACSRTFSAESLSEFDRLDLSAFESDAMVEFFSDIKEKAKTSVALLQKEIRGCYQFFVRNEEQITTITSFEERRNTNEPWSAFGLSMACTEGEGLEWARLWRKIIVLWEANAIIHHSQEQLNHLPTEDEALAVYQQASQSLFTLAGDLMRATWVSRAASVPNATFRGTQEYISAVKQLNEIEYGKNPDLYWQLREAERENFACALQMFPVWAITNLTARTNFPLNPGLFDLIIIDEASQCDIPSAIPLLYRGKKTVIIGDPNQLRHVATLASNLDKQIGRKYGVGLEALSYTSHSLYDMGERSVGFHPGAVLLDEHYRSDPRIISFSNEEFYGNQLKIRTDLTRRGFQKDYLNARGGAFWFNVKGEYTRPTNGSAFNTKELQQIQLIIPKILQALDQEGYKSTSIGIVTPFRAQETKIREWISKALPGNSRIKSGTAHQFQGDECDVIVFSPVLTAGIPDGTLNWLEETYNLLNVAITRARVSLLVVGDFDFCYHNLPASSRYQRLAKYLQDRLNGVYASIDDIPIFGSKRVEVLGTLLDPSNPEFNRTNLIRYIGSCRDFIDWTDPYFDQGIVDLLEELFEKEPYPEIKKIRLMTAERQVVFFDGKPAELKPESIVRIRRQLKKLGIDFDMRVLHGRDLPHDRFFYHPGGAINMPPFSGAYGKHRRVSEYTPSKTTVADFDVYWNKGNPIENYCSSK